MSLTKIALDISSLPESARQELIDFFEFLNQKYSVPAIPKSQKKISFSNFLKESIILDEEKKFTREELHER